MGDINNPDSNFNEPYPPGTLSAPTCYKKNGLIFKSSPKEATRNTETGSIDIKDFSFNESPGTLSTLICHKTDESIFHLSQKEVITKTETTNIVIQYSNFDTSPGTLSGLICHKKEEPIFKSRPTEVNSRKTGTALICHKRDESTLKSNSDESMFDVSSDIDSVHSFKSYFAETELEEDSSRSASLNEEECVKILFDSEWNTDDDEMNSDNIIDDELEERLLSFDYPLDCSEGKTNLDFGIIKNKILETQMFCNLNNDHQDKSLLKNEDDKALNRSMGLCFQNVSTRFHDGKDPVSEFLKLLNRNLNNTGGNEMSSLKTPSIRKNEIFSEKISHTLNDKKNPNGNIFSWITENKEANLNIYSQHDLKYYDMPQNNNLDPYKRQCPSREIRCSTSLLPFASSCEDQPPQNKRLPPKSKSGFVCSLSKEECVKILFSGEWITNDDEIDSDNTTDNELEEMLLNFNVSHEGAERKTNQNFRMIKNETRKRKILCDLDNDDENKSLLENEDDEVLNRSKRLCLLDSCDDDDVTPTMLDEVFLRINLQNVTRFNEEDPLSEISQLLNRNLNIDEKEMNNLERPSISVVEILPEKINHIDEENPNNESIFSWITESKGNLNTYMQYDLKYREMSQKNNLYNFKRPLSLGEIQCSKSVLPLVSPCKDEPPQNKCFSPKSSLSESHGHEMKQTSLKNRIEGNTSDNENCFGVIEEPLPVTFGLSSVERKKFGEYLKRKTAYLCSIYEKIKNEITLSSHVA